VDQRSQGSPVVAGAVGDRLMLWSLRFTLVGFAAISIVVLAELLSIVAFLEPLPTSESVLFIAAAAWVVYWWGSRIAIRVELRPSDTILWHCALRRGEIPVEEVLAVGSSVLLLSNIIRHRRGRVLVFGMVEGFPELVAELERRNPAVEGGLAGWMVRLDRMQRTLLRVPPWRWLPRSDAVRRHPL
jgi:hypothetical protein